MKFTPVAQLVNREPFFARRPTRELKTPFFLSLPHHPHPHTQNPTLSQIRKIGQFPSIPYETKPVLLRHRDYYSTLCRPHKLGRGRKAVVELKLIQRRVGGFAQGSFTHKKINKRIFFFHFLELSRSVQVESWGN